MNEGLSRSEAVGRAIDAERAASGLTQKEMGERLDGAMSVRTLSRVIAGARSATVDELDAIAVVLNLDDAAAILARAAEIAGRVGAGHSTHVEANDNQGSTIVIAGAATVDGDINIDQPAPEQGAGDGVA